MIKKINFGWKNKFIKYSKSNKFGWIKNKKEIVKYSISLHLDDGITSSNKDISIEENAKYTTVLSCKNDVNVVVKMGNKYISKKAYNPKTKTITIASITNDVNIVAKIKTKKKK